MGEIIWHDTSRSIWFVKQSLGGVVQILLSMISSLKWHSTSYHTSDGLSIIRYWIHCSVVLVVRFWAHLYHLTLELIPDPGTLETHWKHLSLFAQILLKQLSFYLFINYSQEKNTFTFIEIMFPESTLYYIYVSIHMTLLILLLLVSPS